MEKETEKIQLMVDEAGKDQRIDKHISAYSLNFQDPLLSLG